MTSVSVARPAFGVPLRTLLIGIVLALTAAETGLAVGTGNRYRLVAPMAAAAAVGLAVLAGTRFELFVLVLLAFRASIDLAKLTGPKGSGQITTTAGPRALDPASLLAVLLLVTGALWLLAQYRRHGVLPGSALRRSLLIFAVTLAVSATTSQTMEASLLEIVRIYSVIMMFVVLEQITRSRRAAGRVVFAVYASAVFPLLFTLAGIVLGSPRSEVKGDFTRLTGTFTQSNDFARYLMILLIFGIAMRPHVAGRLRLALTAILATSAGLLLMTYTVTAFVGTVIGLIVVGLAQSKRVLAALAAAIVLALVLVPSAAARINTVSTPTTADPSGNSLAWRLDYWASVLPLADANPLTGIGPDATQFATSAAKMPHNDYLRAYVETGLLGLAAYVGLLITMIWTGARALGASRRGTFERGIAAGFTGTAVAFVVVSSVSNVISNVVTLWYLVALAAAAVWVARRGAQLEPVPDPSSGTSTRSA